jgi:hypothetical protein
MSTAGSAIRAIAILGTLLAVPATRCVADSGRNPTTNDPLTAERQVFSQSLIREGDRAYRKLRYAQARRAYGDAAANVPGAYAYIMYGDARWRELLQAQDDLRKRDALSSRQACSLSNGDLVHALTMELPQTHERGLAMAPHGAPGSLPESWLLVRAKETALCLRRLISQYDARPAAACVDVTPLRSCLGKPLIPGR